MRPRRAITQSWSWTIRRFGSWREFRGPAFQTGSRMLPRAFSVRQGLPVGSDPDVLAFDPELKRLYVAAESGVVAVFEEQDGALAQLGWYRAPKAHSVAVDPATHRVYLPLANVNGHPILRVLTVVP